MKNILGHAKMAVSVFGLAALGAPVSAQSPDPPQGAISGPGRYPTDGTAPSDKIGPSEKLSDAGALALEKGNLEQARGLYQQALELWPANGDANYGMARICHKAGDTAGELKYYRALTYGGEPSEAGIRICNTSQLLTYAQLLDKADKKAEAITIYNHAALLLKYLSDHPSFCYLLPLLGTEPGQTAYTSARLQALAEVGLGVDSLYTQELKRPERVKHLREAVRLYPDSPVVQCYLSSTLREAGDEPGAKAALAKANSLGLSRVIALTDAQTALRHEQRTQAVGR